MAKSQPSIELDSLDRRILTAIDGNPDLTNRALANRLGSAESTCAYRLRALRDSGVIQGRRLRLNYAALGYPLQAVIKVRLGSHNQQNVDQLYDDLTRTAGVVQVFHVAGGDDFLVHVVAEGAEALRDMVLQHITTHRVVRQVETHLVFELRDGVGVVQSP